MKKRHQQQWKKLLLWQLISKHNVVVALHYLQERSLGSIALILCVLGCWTSSAQAEGSKEMTASGGDRPFLEYSSGTSAGIQRKTIIKVYVQAGETLNLGSSAIGIGSGAINYRKPNNTTGSCPAPGTNDTGKILNRTQEVAGPLPNSNGYKPCIVVAGTGEAGVWEIDFVSPNPSGSPGANSSTSPNPTPITASAAWSPQTTVQPFVTAWDVTVRNTNGNPILGRVFAKYLALNMGGNSRSLSSQVIVLTRDGYQYAIDANGLDPFGFIFYADDDGFTDKTTGKSLYRSIQLASIPTDVTQPNPGAADSLTDKTHKIFFNTPDPLMPTSATTPSSTTWLYSLPVPPPTPSNLQFKGIDGTSSQAGTSLGGNFTFNATGAGPYQIIINLNGNSILGDGNDRILAGTAVAGTNTVFWDGLDGNGTPVPAGTSSYRTTITLYNGEVHFPLLDAETNSNGIIFQRLNNPNPPTSPMPDPYKVYFDDRVLGGTNALIGVDSSSGAHKYSTNFGDIKGIDTWAYYPSQTAEVAGGITVAEADFSITKTHSPAQIQAGRLITYTIAVTNNSTTTFGNSAVVKDTFNSAITNVSWTCAIATEGTGSGISSCANSSGTGNINNAVSLRPGGVATFTITGTVDPSFTGNTLSNTATVTRSYDAADPNTANNSATDIATIAQSADLKLTKVANPASPAVFSHFNYVIIVTNDGPSTATNVQVKDDLPLGIGYVANTPSQGTYDSINTKVWNIGTLAPGASATLTIEAIRNIAGNTVNTAEVIAADQSDPDSPHNNHVSGEDDQDSVTVPSQSVDLAVTKIVDKSTPTVGQNVTFTTTVTNPSSSTATATGVGLTDAMPDGLTYQSHTASTGTYNSSGGVWNIGTLNSGTTATLAITAKVTTSGAKTNTAQLSALDQTDTNTGNNTASAIVSASSLTPQLSLVKRITAIDDNKTQNPNDGTPLNVFVNDPDSTVDDDPNWSNRNTYLKGAIDGGRVKPGDEVEYTIYFLNNQASATNVAICDLIPTHETFVSSGYNTASPHPTEAGALPTDTGIALALDGNTLPINPTFYLTNINDSDRGRYYPPRDPSTPSTCKKLDAQNNPISSGSAANTNGAVVVEVVRGTGTANQLPPATAPGSPSNSYGFIRFKAKVN